MYLKKEKLEVKTGNERAGLLFSTFSNILFIVLELCVASFSRSHAVLIDGLFDGCETVLLFFSLWLMRYLYKPASEKRPIGYSNLEPFYMILKGLLFVAIAVIMAQSSISGLFSGGYSVRMDVVSYFELFAGVYGLFAYLILRRVNAKARSPILSLEMKEWIFDIVGSLSTAAAFVVAILTAHTPLRFLHNDLDPIITMFMIAYILPAPLKAMKRGFEELFFLSPSEKILETVKSASAEIAAKYGIAKEQLDIEVVKTGRRLWISVYVTPKSQFLDVSLFKKLHAEMEARFVTLALADIVDVDVIPDIW